MKKEALLLWTLPFVMVFVGLFAGFYFGIYRTSVALTACELSKTIIAPSPVVTKSLYNEKTHQLQLTVKNYGTMPILLVDKTLVLKPANINKQTSLIMSSIPLGLTVPSEWEVTFNLDLWKIWTGFKIGDVLETTLTYKLPVSNDIYAVVHLFKKSNNKNADNLIENQFWDNQVKVDTYSKKENVKK